VGIVDDRDHRAAVHDVVLDIVGRRQLRHRHRDRTGVDRAQDRGRRLQRIAHEDQYALAARELERAQRTRGLGDGGRELVERPRPRALAQRRARSRAARERPLE
jgi:hypothetical protein